MKKLVALLIAFSMMIVSCSSAKTKIGDVKKVDTNKFTVEQKKKLDDMNCLITNMQKSRGDDFYKNISKEDFEKEKNAFIEKIPKLTDMTFYFEIKHLLSLFHDNTMVVYPSRDFQMKMDYLPFSVYYLDGSYYVISSNDEKYLGYKLDAINGMDMDKVVEKLKYVESYENKQSQYYILNGYLQPELLKYLNIIDDTKKIKFTMEKDGKKEEFEIESISAQAMLNLNNRQVIKRKKDTSVLKNYDSKLIDKDDYYIELSITKEDDYNSISKFVKKITDDYNKNKYKKLIVDFRMNNNCIPNNNTNNPELFLPVIKEIQEIHKHGVKVYVLIDNYTGGTVMANCMQLKKYTGCTFVGEPTFSNVNSFGSSNAQATMQNSQMTVGYSNKFALNDASYKNEALTPDVNVKVTFEDFINVDDKALQYVLNN